MRGLWIGAAALAVMASAGTAAAQERPFVAEFNTMGTPMETADKLVSVTATGPMQAWRGRPWWHVLSFCVGLYEYRAFEAEKEGEAALAEAMRAEASWFFDRAIFRVIDDRGIDEDTAHDVISPDYNMQMIVAAENPRRFAEDVARCRAYEAAHAEADPGVPRRTPPPAPAPRPAPPPAAVAATPAAPFERRFAAQADITRRYDGEPYWELMLRCAMGSQGVPGPRGEMMGQFGRAAVELLNHDRGISMADARAALEAAAPGVQPIAPGTSEADDACIAIGRQLQGEVTGGAR